MGPALEIMRLWPQVAGPMISAHLNPVRFRQGTLFVVADQSTWGHQLSFLAPELLARYERLVGPELVRELHLATHGPLPDAPVPPELAPPPLGEWRGPRSAPLAASEEAAIAREAAAYIAKPELAERFAAVQRAVKRLQLGRRQAGCRPCTACGVPHDGPGPRCPLCRFDRP